MNGLTETAEKHKMTCRICGNDENNQTYLVKEMMLSTRKDFEYFQCTSCGCLQISTYPSNIAEYYPNGYYSFRAPERPATLREHAIWHRDRYLATGKGLIGAFLSRIHPDSVYQSIRRGQVKFNARILDVGCGAGHMLASLESFGFTDLTGIDPYVAASRKYSSKRRVVKTNLDEVRGTFDFIMFNHSLEHMANQANVLRTVTKVLSPNGILMVRVPVASSYAWEEYRESWVQLDAPRHYYLHTLKSIEITAKQAGLFLQDFYHDSSGFQIYGSEYYRRNLTPKDVADLPQALFTKSEYRAHEARARELNLMGQGDQAVFYFRHASKEQNA